MAAPLTTTQDAIASIQYRFLHVKVQVTLQPLSLFTYMYTSLSIYILYTALYELVFYLRALGIDVVILTDFNAATQEQLVDLRRLATGSLAGVGFSDEPNHSEQSDEPNEPGEPDEPGNKTHAHRHVYVSRKGEYTNGFIDTYGNLKYRLLEFCLWSGDMAGHALTLDTVAHRKSQHNHKCCFLFARDELESDLLEDLRKQQLEKEANPASQP